MHKYRYLPLIFALAFVFLSGCTSLKKDVSSTDVTSANRYSLCIMNAETGEFEESQNILQTDEKRDVEFLVKKVSERLGIDVIPAEVSIQSDKVIVILPDNAPVLQDISIKLKTAFFTSVAKTIEANADKNIALDKEYIEFCANGQAYYIYEFENDRLVALRN